MERFPKQFNSGKESGPGAKSRGWRMWMRCQERRPRAAGCGLAPVGGWGEFGILTKLPIRERRDGRAAKHGVGEHWGAVRRELRMMGRWRRLTIVKTARTAGDQVKRNIAPAASARDRGAVDGGPQKVFYSKWCEGCNGKQKKAAGKKRQETLGEKARFLDFLCFFSFPLCLRCENALGPAWQLLRLCVCPVLGTTLPGGALICG